MSEIESYAGLAFNLPSGHLFRNSIQNLQPYGAFAAELVGGAGRRAVGGQLFEHPDVTLAQRANDAALGLKPKTPKQPTLQPAQISTLVLNGTTVPGLAHNTAYQVAQSRLPRRPAARDDDADRATRRARTTTRRTSTTTRCSRTRARPATS